MPFERLDHTGDIGLRVTAGSASALFEEAARALTAIMCEPGSIRARTRREVHLEAPALDLLLVDWLNELLYRFEVDRLLVHSARVRLTHGQDTVQLEATVRGETYDPAVHPLNTLLKAVTYHGLELEETPEHWRASMIVDI